MASTSIHPEEIGFRRKWLPRFIYAGCVGLAVVFVLILFFFDRKPQQRFVTLDAIILTSPPSLTPPNFLQDIKLAGGWSDRLEISDPALLERLHQVCSQHPRVAKVRSISLVAEQKIQLDLQFRQPVARLYQSGKLNLVDREGYLLEPLANESVSDLLELRGWESLWPLDEKAKSWLTTAALLAELLQRHSDHWALAAIVLVRQPVLGSELRLLTKSNRQIIWQTLDNSNQPEPLAEEKLTRLQAYFDQYGEIPAGKMLDMRSKEGVRRLEQTP